MQTTNGLWVTSDFTRFFLIPARVLPAPGLESIYDMQGNKRLVSLASLALFSCSQERAREHLHAGWQASLAATRQAWLDLYNFCQRTGQELDLNELGRQFREGLDMADERAREAFDMGRALTESVAAAAQGSGSEAEQQALFKKVFRQLPQLLEQFSDESLERAAEDPEAWAQRLSQQVFGEAEQRRKDRQRQKLAEEIQASIAARLREAGLTPSADFEGKRDRGE